MRFAFVGAVPPLRGGISQHSARTIAALRRRGHDVDVHSWRSQYPTWLYPGQRQRPQTGHVAGARFSLRWWNPLSWLRVGRSVRSSEALVVPWVTPLQAPAIWVLARVSGIPLVLLMHNPEPHERQPFARRLTRFVLRRSTGVVCQTEASASAVLALWPRTRIVIAAHPPNLELSPQPFPELPLRLLFFGFIRPYKGVDVLLAAVSRLSQEDELRLTLAGDVWGDLHELERQIAEAGVDDIVHRRFGYVQDHEIPELFSQHHLVVLPYRSATQSGVIPLAASAGRGVVTTDTGGLGEQIEDGVTGILVPPADPEALATGIRTAASRYQDLGVAAARRAPSWNDVADAVTDAARPDR